MANEEVLRLRTTVVSDEALAQIRALGREIGLMPAKAKPGVKDLDNTFGALGKTIKQLGGEITTVIPALGGLGLGAAGAAGAMAAIIATMTAASKRIVELKYASKELGMSERDIRAWSSTAEKAGVSAQSMMSGMQAFKKTTDGLKYNIGGARDELYAMGAGPIVQRMQAAATQADKMKVAFKFKDELMKDDPSGFKARMFFDQLGLGADKARLSYEAFVESQAGMRERTEEEQQAAEDYAKALVKLGDQWDDLVIKTGAGLFPKLTQDMKDLEGLLGLLGKLDGWADAWLGKSKNPNADLIGRLVTKGNEAIGLDKWDPFGWKAQHKKEDEEKAAAEGGATPEATPAIPFNERFPATPNEFGSSPALRQNRNELIKRGRNLYHPSSYSVEGGGANPLLHRASFSDGFQPASAGGGLNEGSRMVKDGVFAALVDFQSYIQTGGATAAGGGVMQASFGGSAGAAAGGGVGGSGAASFSGGAGTGVGTGTDGGGGSGGGTGGGAPAGSSVPGDTGTGELPGSVPKDVMQTARNMLTRGASTGQLQKFMADNGYPRSGAWCGQFAASVVKSSGMTPPKGAAVASNWLNWGEHVDPKDVREGDVAVRKTSRYGGAVVPGQTGGHVAIAGGGIKDGRFEAVGGNQGGIHGANASQYEFRRGVEKQQTAEKTGAALPGGASAGGGRIEGGGDVNEAIRATARKAGMDEAHWKAIASIESSLTPGSNANKATQYKGLFQIGSRGAQSEWARKGSGNIYNARDNAEAAAALAAENNAAFKKHFGRDPTSTETYMMHQQGLGFYTRGKMTNIAGNPYPGMRGPQTPQSFEAGWGREIDRRAARFNTDRIDGAVNTAANGSTKAEGSVKVQIESNGTAAKAKASTDGGLWQKSTIENYRQMQPTSRPVQTVDQSMSI